MKLTKEEGRQLVYEDLKGWSKEKSQIIGTNRWSIIYEGVFLHENSGKYYKTTWSTGATEQQEEKPFEFDAPELTEVVPTSVVQYEFKEKGKILPRELSSNVQDFILREDGIVLHKTNDLWYARKYDPKEIMDSKWDVFTGNGWGSAACLISDYGFESIDRLQELIELNKQTEVSKDVINERTNLLKGLK